jgi:toxin YoeB
MRYWIETDRKTALHIWALMDACLRDPFSGIGKPERLRHLPNAWSRRINQYDRLTYVVKDDAIVFLQCRYHYGR